MKKLIILSIALVIFLIPASMLWGNDGASEEASAGLVGVIEEIGKNNQSILLDNGTNVLIQTHVSVIALDGSKSSIKFLMKGQRVEVQGEMDLQGIVASKIIVLPAQ